MAREYGKAWFAMFTDDHFTAQPNVDKFLYMTLLGQPSLNYAGVTPINLKRWRKAIREGDRVPSEQEIKLALIRLERNEYVFTDDDTGEVLVRSFMRRDEIYKMPNVMLSGLRAIAQVESPKLARVLQSELARVEVPTINGDSAKATKLGADLHRAYRDAVSHLDSLAEGFVEPSSEPFSEDFPEGLPEPLSEPFTKPFREGFSRPGKTEPFGEPFGEGFGEGSVVVEVEVDPFGTADENLGGRAGAHIRTREAGAQPPSPNCSQHPQGTDAPCRACGRARQARAEWDSEDQRAAKAALASDNRQRAAVRRQAIDECDLCDEDGYDGMRPCDHVRRESFAPKRGDDA